MPATRITSIEVRRIQIPMGGGFEHARAKRTATDNIVCALTLSDGSVGYGEGVPRDYVTGETIESVWSVLEALELPVTPVASMAEALELAEGVTAGIVDRAPVVHNACRAAIELAILDSFGRVFAIPASAAVTAYAGSRPGPVCTHSLVLDRNGPKNRERLDQLRSRYGFRAAKIKVGFGVDEDLASIAAVRDALGPDSELRLDANREWTLDQALATMTRARELGVIVVEDPLRGQTVEEQAEGLTTLRKHGFEVVLDEPIRTFEEARRAIELGVVDVFNLRVSKNGGLIRTARIAKLAQEHGIGLQVGTQVGETAILSAAGRHLAYSAGPVRFMESCNEHMKFTRDHYVSEEDLNYDEHATSGPLTGPGLGITVIPSQLARFTTAQFRRDVART
jgi:L-Ala-D/L-Glu epimerase